MSGGHWDYGKRIRDTKDSLRYTDALWELMEVIEHELDWGICCDTCLDCAKKRVAESLIVYLDNYLDNPSLAIAVARDNKQNLCNNCKERLAS